MLLDVAHLRVVFRRGTRDIPVVDDVSFTVDRGEVLGLVGESGSGKSLTALAVLGLVPPTARITGGHVALDGHDLLGDNNEQIRRVRGKRIGFIFQEPAAALNPVYTIGYQLAETLAVHGIARGRAAHDRAVELLGLAGITDAARRAREYPHELSGGLRQRAMIALALACDPELVIADEPTTALDARLQADVLERLAAARKARNLAMLFISHDLPVVASIADRVAVMQSGRIVETAPVEQLLRAPAHPYTRHLLDCSAL